MPNDEDFITEVGSRVTATRQVEGRSVAWLSEKSGIADKTLRRRLSDPAQFSLAELNSIARVLHCDLETFFTRHLEDLRQAG